MVFGKKKDVENVSAPVTEAVISDDVPKAEKISLNEVLSNKALLDEELARRTIETHSMVCEIYTWMKSQIEKGG